MACIATGPAVWDAFLQVPVMFLQCKGRESRTAASIGVSRQRESLDSTDGDESSSSGGSGGYSYSNADEAALVFSCLKRLLVSGMLPQDVCVITPYRCDCTVVQSKTPSGPVSRTKPDTE